VTIAFAALGFLLWWLLKRARGDRESALEHLAH
jgi:hypothetical protein